MSRDILFRGKRINTGEWIEGYYTKRYFAGRHIEIIERHEVKGVYEHHTEYTYRPYEVISKTVSEYTGLTDINSKKIFEGDIVQTCEDKHSKIFVIKRKRDMLGYQYYLEKIDGSEYKPYMPYAMHIIGNIHDNPELLTR